MTRPYVAFVRKYHPQGWDHCFWAGITRREGNRRATDVCRHLHTSEADALRCAEHLADLLAHAGRVPGIKSLAQAFAHGVTRGITHDLVHMALLRLAVLADGIGDLRKCV